MKIKTLFFFSKYLCSSLRSWSSRKAWKVTQQQTNTNPLKAPKKAEGMAGQTSRCQTVLKPSGVNTVSHWKIRTQRPVRRKTARRTERSGHGMSTSFLSGVRTLSWLTHSHFDFSFLFKISPELWVYLTQMCFKFVNLLVVFWWSSVTTGTADEEPEKTLM